MGVFERVASWFSPREAKTNPRWMSLGYYDDVPMAVRMSKNFKTFVKEGYKDSDTLYKCVSYIIRNGAAIPPVLYTDATKQKRIDKHPLLDLLNKPNIEQSGVAYRESVLGYKLLAGNCFQYCIRTAPNKPPSELWTLRPDKVEVQIVKNKGIVGYKYDTIKDVILPSEIGHTKYWNPDDDDQAGMGLSPLEAAALNVDMQSHSKKWNLALLQNSARPPGIWKYGSGPKDLLGVNERTKLEAKLNEKFTGPKGAGKAPLFDGGIDWKPTGLGPAEMDFLDSLKYNGGAIANIFNIAPQLIGDTSSSTYDNMEQAKAASYTEAIFPELDDLYALWNVWLVPMYSDLQNGAYLYYDKETVEVIQNLIQAQKNAQAQRASQMWDAGECTMNEARELAGLPSLGPDGEVFKFGAILVKKDELGKYADQSLTSPASPPPAKAEPLNAPQSGQPGQPSQSNDQSSQDNNNQQEQGNNNKPNTDTSDNTDDDADNNDDSKPDKSNNSQKRLKKANDDNKHDGVMIAFFVDPKTAEKLAIPDGEDPNDLHVTLAFLGNKENLSVDEDTLKGLVEDFASNAPALSGTTSGVGRFSPSESSDGLSPIYASLNIAGIQKFRANLVEALEDENIDVAQNWEYTPHITLSYVNNNDQTPINTIPTLNLNFDKLWLCIGDDRYSWPLKGTTKKRRLPMVKALDLSTDEEKRSYAKSMQSSIDTWETEAEQRFKDYFENERKSVVAAVDRAALASSTDLRADAALDKQSDALKDLFIKLYEDIANDVGNDVLTQLKAGAMPHEVKNASSIINSKTQEYLQKMAATKVKNISDTTRQQIKRELSEGIANNETVSQLAKRIDGLYLSSIIPNRSTVIAQTESHSASGYAAWMAGKSSGMALDKVWLSLHDAKTRSAHSEADGQQVGIDEPFIVDGEELDYPGDNSKGSAGNTIRCRCSMYLKKSTKSLNINNNYDKNSDNNDINNEKTALRAMTRNAYRDYMRGVLV